MESDNQGSDDGDEEQAAATPVAAETTSSARPSQDPERKSAHPGSMACAGDPTACCRPHPRRLAQRIFYRVDTLALAELTTCWHCFRAFFTSYFYARVAFVLLRKLPK